MTAPLDTAALLALVAEARAKADAATPGPWVSNMPDAGVAAIRSATAVIASNVRGRDSRHIIAARSAVPALCDAVEAMVRERDDAEEREQIVRNTLRSDEEQIRNWGKRHAEMRDDLIETARARDEARAEFTLARNEARDAGRREHERIAERDRYRRLVAQAAIASARAFDSTKLAHDAFPGATWADIEKIAKGDE